MENPSIMHHVSLGTDDMEAAGKFYDAFLGPLGAKRIYDFEFGIGYGKQWPEFWIGLAHDRQPATVGNGAHVAFIAPDKETVHAVHAAGIEAGGTDDGAPGPRPDYGPDYYAGFLRDPFGNKVEVAIVPES